MPLISPATLRQLQAMLAKAMLAGVVLVASGLLGTVSQRVSRCESTTDIESLELEIVPCEGHRRRLCRGKQPRRRHADAGTHGGADSSATRGSVARRALLLDPRGELALRNGVGAPLRC